MQSDSIFTAQNAVRKRVLTAHEKQLMQYISYWTAHRTA